MEDLFNAIKLFNSSMSDLATTRAVNEAREQVNMINQNVTKEGEKRQALSAMANDLVLRLSGAGAPATTIQAAFQAVAPEQFANPEQAEWAGMLNQADSLQGAAQQGIAAGMGRKKEMMDREFGYDIAKIREQAKLNQELYSMKAEDKAKQGKPIPSTILKGLESPEEAKVSALGILELLKGKTTAAGPIASRVPLRSTLDKDFAVYQSQIRQFFNSYRKEITGAGASNEELKQLEESLFTANDRPEIAEAKLMKILQLAERKKAQKIDFYKRAGKYDLSGYEETLDQDLLQGWSPNQKLRDVGKSTQGGMAPSSSSSSPQTAAPSYKKYIVE